MERIQSLRADSTVERRKLQMVRDEQDHLRDIRRELDGLVPETVTLVRRCTDLCDIAHLMQKRMTLDQGRTTKNMMTASGSAILSDMVDMASTREEVLKIVENAVTRFVEGAKEVRDRSPLTLAQKNTTWCLIVELENSLSVLGAGAPYKRVPVTEIFTLLTLLWLCYYFYV